MGLECRVKLRRWGGCCLFGSFASGQVVRHTDQGCPGHNDPRWAEVEEEQQRIRREMFEAGRLAPSSGCLDCGLPQAICQQGRADEGDGKGPGRSCQYSGLLMRFYACVGVLFPDASFQLIEGLVEKDGWVRSSKDWLVDWLGCGTEWGGYETNQMCRGFYWLCRMVEGRVL